MTMNLVTTTMSLVTTTEPDLRTCPASWGYERACSLGLDPAEAGRFSNRIVAAHAAGAAFTDRKPDLLTAANDYTCNPDEIRAFIAGAYTQPRRAEALRKARARNRVFNEGVVAGRREPHRDAPPLSNYAIDSDYDVRFQRGFAYGQAETRAEQEAA